MSFRHEYTVPAYYPNFKCKTGDCRHPCCIGWDIAIGMEEYFRVKFNPKEIAPKLKEGPINIEFTPGIDANKGKPEEFEKDGELIRIPVLWINRYDVGDPWEDHSLDDYE